MSRAIWSRIFQGETLLSLDCERLDSFENHGKLRGTDHDDRLVVVGECHRKPESTGFKPLGPQGVSVTIPVQDFESVGGTVDLYLFLW